MSIRSAAQVATLVAGLSLTGVAGAEHEAPRASSGMTQARLEAIIREVTGTAEGQAGFVRFVVDGVAMACISDVRHDRMRIIAPIVEASTLTPAQTERILEANFHTALDARYATSRGRLYAVFVHPLSGLTEAELRGAIRQVSALAKTFGTTYSSGELSFGGGRE